MRKTIYTLALFVGFIFMLSESTTFIPNFLGAAAFLYAAYKLELLTTLK